jgi:putative addiction module component (TIGR02574 family)
MQLDPADRAVLAADLQESLAQPDNASPEETDAAWLAEAERRSAELPSGQVRAVPWDEVRAGIDAILSGY